MRYYLFFFLLFFSFALNAQTKQNEYKEVDEKIAQFSNVSNDNEIYKLAAFINDNFSTESDKLRASFVWITNNFEYDVENMFALNYYSEIQEIIDVILKNRKGICLHFACLFNEIANLLDIKTYVVYGYTKQQGFVDYIPHAWCANFIDSSWFFVDPTWGSGYIQNQKFVRKQDNFYFKTKPEDLIKTHIPFDPLWQFLYYPISSQEFYEGNTVINKEKPFFNYVDTLITYKNSSKIEQLISTKRRIEQNGVKNTLTFNELQNIAREIEYYRNQKITDDYNAAVYFYNDGINKLNRFIDYRNNQFTPQKSEIEIRDMVISAENSLTNSLNELQKITTSDINTINLINQLKISINEALKQSYEQIEFINKYFTTNKMFRKSLFYKYTWFGIPLN